MPPAIASPRYALSEAALRLLRHAETVLAGTLPDQPPMPRISATLPGPTTDPREWRQEASFLRLLSITESYVDALSEEWFSSNVDISIDILRRMVVEIDSSASRTWRAREDAYRIHHDVKLHKCPHYKLLMIAAQVRNCFTHGLGRLTVRQLGNPNLVQDVAKLDVSIGNGRMHFGPATMQEAARVCRAFVKELDERFHGT